MISKITAAYITNFRYADAEKVFVETQNYSRAADMWKNIGFKENARKHAIKVLENKEKSISERRNAWFHFTGETDAERQIRKK